MFSISKQLKTTAIVTAGFILFVSTALALIAWYLAPVVFPDIQTQRNRGNAPPLTSLVIDKVGFNETISMKDLSIKVWTDPADIKPNDQAQLFLKILDNSGNPVSLDTSIHFTKVHTYAVRDDLGGDVLHLHPSETAKGSGVWRTLITFPSASIWHLVNQTSKDGVAYHLDTTFNVGGTKQKTFTPDFSRNKDLSKWQVELDVDKEVIKVGEPVKFTFNLTPKQGEDTPKLEGTILNNGHNLILARLQDSLIWNQHGDSSVENVSKQVGLIVKRVPTESAPFAHLVTFPKPGVWLLHFELQSKPVHFFVKVGS